MSFKNVTDLNDCVVNWNNKGEFPGVCIFSLLLSKQQVHLSELKYSFKLFNNLRNIIAPSERGSVVQIVNKIYLHACGLLLLRALQKQKRNWKVAATHSDDDEPMPLSSSFENNESARTVKMVSTFTFSFIDHCKAPTWCFHTIESCRLFLLFQAGPYQYLFHFSVSSHSASKLLCYCFVLGVI